jgi:hypothetical protein
MLHISQILFKRVYSIFERQYSFGLWATFPFGTGLATKFLVKRGKNLILFRREKWERYTLVNFTANFVEVKSYR